MHNFSPHDENDLVAALRAGDESAFTQIVERYHANMVRIASLYVGDVQIAQEVTQETWVVVLHSLNRFEGRSSLKTWLFTILTNRAKTRAARENRYVPLEDSGELDDEPSVAAARFRPESELEWADHWKSNAKPQTWGINPEAHVIAGEVNSVIASAIAALPTHQREVIRLHDIDNFSTDEICNILQITPTNQRVLLHRARSRVRHALELYFQRSP